VRVLVGGGAGLLGCALAQALLSEAKHVVLADVFDDAGDGRAVKEERAGRIGRHPWATVSRGDLRDRSFVSRLLRETRPDAVVNAARFAPDGPGAVELAIASREEKVGVFVHLSDARLYGAPPEPGHRASEDEPVAPEGDPGLRARAAEEEAVRASGAPAVVLRVFDVLGPAFPHGRFPVDELDAMLAGEELPEIGAEPRDFLNVRDAARAVLLALEKRPFGETVNVGSGVATTPRALLSALAARAGVAARIGVERRTDRAPRIADVERAWTLLGFAPSIPLERTVEEIVAVRLARSEPAPQPAEAPSRVSRRELFDLFRRKR
jgi:nucleoside-diphosphate-sugar epimerase